MTSAADGRGQQSRSQPAFPAWNHWTLPCRQEDAAATTRRVFTRKNWPLSSTLPTHTLRLFCLVSNQLHCTPYISNQPGVGRSSLGAAARLKSTNGIAAYDVHNNKTRSVSRPAAAPGPWQWHWVRCSLQMSLTVWTHHSIEWAPVLWCCWWLRLGLKVTGWPSSLPASQCFQHKLLSHHSSLSNVLQ